VADFQAVALAVAAVEAGKNLLCKFFPAGVDEHKKWSH
jgi:hypothetical protein